jgi:hypothetical protein
MVLGHQGRQQWPVAKHEQNRATLKL